MRIFILFVAATLISGAAALPASAITCKSYSACQQAVVNWCEGRHPRADGDGDGIPCENVCSSVRQVNAIRESLGLNCPPAR